MITIAIIDDHQILVEALELMLTCNPEFAFLGAATTLATGYELVLRTQPDVLLLDIHLPDGSGYDLVPDVIQISPKTHVVVLTSSTDEVTVLRAVDLGVSGFLPKSAPLSDFYHTIQKVNEGEIVIPPNLLIGLLRRVSRDRTVFSQDDRFWERLTPREYEILACLAAGKSGFAIATELNIAPLTVRTHVRNLMSKLGVHSRLEAVAFGVKHQLLESSMLSSS
jgi:DNA-binding NarL/FixJ family response regulator